MKVIVFRNEVLPRSETFVYAQARALQECEVTFAGVHPAASPLPLDRSPVLLSKSSGLVGKVQRRLFWRTSAAPGFRRRLRAIRPDLIHAHFAIDGAAALPLCRSLGIPLVVTLHGYDVTSSDEALSCSPEGRLYLRRRQALWKQSVAFLCISNFIRESALQRGFPENKLRLHYTGTDLGLFRPEAVRRDRHLLLFVGRFVDKKGCHHLLDALALLRTVVPEARLVMVGHGPLEASLRERVRLEQLPCLFAGTQPAEVVRDHMARARVFCVPSVRAPNGDSEGLGMVFAEAQAMGLPVASFAHGGIPEVVLHGETGLLAPEGDTASLAENLRVLLTDDRLWAQLSARGPVWVRQHFDIQLQTAKLSAIYKSVLPSKL